MKKKIYNKKGFLSGIVSVILSMLTIIIVIPNEYVNGKNVQLIKSIIFGIILLLLGITAIKRSISYKCTKEDIQNDDEREKLLSLKSTNDAFKIGISFSIIFIVLLIIAFTKTNYEGFIGILIGVSLTFNVLMISSIGAYFYHDRHN